MEVSMKNNFLYLMIILSMTISVISAQTDWQSTSTAGVTFEYRVTQDGLHLEGIMIGQTTGWVAVGFNPSQQMRDANIIIAYVTASNTMIRDDWGTSTTSHASDVSLGGSSDVTLINGMEEGNFTTIHFTIPLDSGDQYDQPLSVGQTYPIILARGPNGVDNFTAGHTAAGYAEITLLDPVSVDDQSLIIKPTDRILSIYPNPFQDYTNVRYSLLESSEVEVSFYNLRGQLVNRVVKEQYQGEHELIWQPDNLSSGTYFMLFRTRNGIQSQRIIIMK